MARRSSVRARVRTIAFHLEVLLYGDEPETIQNQGALYHRDIEESAVGC